MSTPKTTPWKRFIMAFLILIVALGAIATAEGIAIIDVNNDKTNLQNQYNALRTLDTQNNQTIIALNAKVSSLQTQLQANYTEVQTLNGQIATDNALITHLQAELQANYTQVQTLTAQIAQLQTKITDLNNQIIMLQKQVAQLQSQLNTANQEIASLQAPDVIGAIQQSITAPICIPLIGCIVPGSATLTALVWANVGTLNAPVSTATVTFYFDSGMSCSVTQSLGVTSVAGRSVAGLTGLSDSCNTGDFTADPSLTTISFS